MKILFAHQNFPGQYLPLARHLGASGEHEVIFLTQRRDAELPGVRKFVYTPKRAVTGGIHHYLRETEAGILNGQEVLRSCLELRDAGFVPDVMIGHNGWGEIWYLKEVFPKSPLIGYFEFFYRYDGADVGFEPDSPNELDTGPRVRTKNLGNLIGLDASDLGQCPTHWQRSLYPECYRPKLHVIHEGVDTRVVAPNPQAKLKIANVDGEFAVGDEIVTYVARNLEPYRGFPSFMRSLPKILAARPKARVIIVGGDGVSYGSPLPEGKTFKSELLKELGDNLDLSRVHFLGKVPYNVFLGILQISSVHVYLTYPFVLSWSMIEAMSTGCLVVASRTPPVQEVIRDQVNGILVDIFSIDEIANRVIEGLAEPDQFKHVRAAARRTAIDQYDLQSVCLPAQLRLLRLAAPPPQESIWGARRA
jgi:glycosyltransferase involved in cell wall biosynthesis